MCVPLSARAVFAFVLTRFSGWRLGSIPVFMIVASDAVVVRVSVVAMVVMCRSNLSRRMVAAARRSWRRSGSK